MALAKKRTMKKAARPRKSTANSPQMKWKRAPAQRRIKRVKANPDDLPEPIASFEL